MIQEENRKMKESKDKDKIEADKEKGKGESGKEKDKGEMEEKSKDEEDEEEKGTRKETDMENIGKESLKKENVSKDRITEDDEDIPDELDNNPFYHGLVSSDDLCFILSEVRFINQLEITKIRNPVFTVTWNISLAWQLSFS